MPLLDERPTSAGLQDRLGMSAEQERPDAVACTREQGSAPAGREVREVEAPERRFEVTAPKFEGIERLRVEVEIDGQRYSAEFAVLSPSEGRGFASTQTVEHCPICQGRKGSCICPEVYQRPAEAEGCLTATCASIGSSQALG